jgi:hypothetical protein
MKPVVWDTQRDLLEIALTGDATKFAKTAVHVPKFVLNTPIRGSDLMKLNQLKPLVDETRAMSGGAPCPLASIRIPLIMAVAWIGHAKMVSAIADRVDVNRDAFCKRKRGIHFTMIDALIMTKPRRATRRVTLLMCMEVLIKAGYLLNRTDRPKNASALEAAVLTENVDAFKLFLRHGADPATRDINGENVVDMILNEAHERGLSKLGTMLAWMIDNGYVKKRMNALHRLVRFGNVSLIRRVISRVYDEAIPTTRDASGLRILDIVQRDAFDDHVPKSARKRIFDITTRSARNAAKISMFLATNLPEELRQNVLHKAGLSRYRATNRRRNRRT